MNPLNRSARDPSRGAQDRRDPRVQLDLRPGQSIELLKALHILTREGRLNLDSRRKLKQVRHLCQFIGPLLEEVRSRHPEVHLVDHGAGNAGHIRNGSEHLLRLFFQHREIVPEYLYYDLSVDL